MFGVCGCVFVGMGGGGGGGGGRGGGGGDVGCKRLFGGDKLNYLCSLLARIAAINVYKSPEHGPNLSGS